MRGEVAARLGDGAADSDLTPAAKEQRLFEALTAFRSVVVAYSGGVDSAYLAWAATRVLGASALCITADSPSYPDHHRQLARRIAHEFGFRHEFIATAELEVAEYRANPVNRCYYCKQELYRSLTRLARDRGYAVIVDGNGASDRGDFRPGRQAAREMGVRSPLDDCDLLKDDIRALSRQAGLPTWDEPASACLSSRIPYHSHVTESKLRLIERAEAALRAMGFRVCRVRHHEEAGAGAVTARACVEIGVEDLARAQTPEMRDRIARELRAVGYGEIAIDPRGYRTGSLNEGLLLRTIPSSVD